MSGDIRLGITIRADGSAQVDGELDRIRNGLNGAGNAAQGANRQFAAGAVALRALFGVLAVVSFAELVRDLIKTVEQVQNLEIRLKGLTKGAKDYADVQAFLSDVSQRHHKDNLELADSFSKLLTIEQTGLITRTQSKAILEGLSNAQTATGASTVQLGQTMYGLAQALGSGAVHMEELNQVVEPMPGLLNKIAAASGYTTGEFRKLVADGRISSDMFGRIMVDALAQYQGAAEAAGSTLTAQYADVRNAWIDLAKAVEAPVSETITPVLKGVRYVLQGLAQDIRDIDRVYQSVKGIFEGFETIKAQGMRPPDYKKAQADAAAAIVPDVKAVSDASAKIRAEIEATAAASKKATDVQTAASAAAKKAAEVLASLTDKYNKLTMSTHDSNKALFESQGLKNQDLAKALALTDAIDQAEIAKTASAASTREANSEAKAAAEDAQRQAEAFQQSYENEIKSLVDRNAQLSQSARDYEITTLSAKGFNAEMVNEAMRVWDVNAAWDAKKKVQEAELSALDQLMDKYHQLTLSARDYYQLTLSKQGINTEEQKPILQQFDQNAAIEANQKSIEAAKSSVDQYINSLDSAGKSTQNLGDISSAVFDGALGGINTVIGAFENLSKQLEDNAKKLAENGKAQIENNKLAAGPEKIANFKRLFSEQASLEKQNTINQLAGIRQIAGASAQMFKENSTGRKILHGIEMAAGIAELAQQISLLTVKGASAVLTQGQGEPYTAFARIAAMIGIVAGIISAAGGTFSSGGGASAPPPSGTKDTGTVLGDTTATSDSANKVYELLKTIHAEEYVELRGINKGVGLLHNAITGTIERIFQSPKLGTGIYDPQVEGLGSVYKGFEMYFAQTNIKDPITNMIIKALFGGTVTKSIVGGGLATAPISIGDTLSGNLIGAAQYNTIKTTKKGGLLGTDKTSYDTVLTQINDDVQQSLTDLFKGIGTTMVSLAEILGDGVADKVRDYIIPSVMIELRGLNGEDATKKLNGVISTVIDTMAEAVFGDIIGQYQKLGEGMLETAIRIVSEVAVVRDALAQSGLSLAKNAIEIADSLVQAAGGIEEFQKQFATFYDKFYTAAEKQARLTTQLQGRLTGIFTPEQIATLGTARTGFRQVIEALDLTNSADRERYSLLLSLSDAADQYYQGIEKAAADLAKAADEAAKAAADALAAQIKYDTERRKQLEDELAAIKKTNAANRSDLVDARRAADITLADSAKKAQEALTDAATGMDAMRVSLLAAGDAAGLVENEMRKSTLASQRFSSQGAFNFAFASEQAKAAQTLSGRVSSNALQTPDVEKVLGQLAQFGKSPELLKPMATAISQSIAKGSVVIRDAIGDFADMAAAKMANALYQAKGSGLTSVYAAQENLKDASLSGFANGKIQFGKDVIAYGQAIDNLNRQQKLGKITADQYAAATQALKREMGDAAGLLNDTAAQLAKVSSALQHLGEAGLSSVNFYFGQLSKQAGELAASAAAANEPIAQTTAAIGRMHSITSAFGDSAAAAIKGFRGDAAMMQSLRKPGSSVNNALLVAQAAAIASQVLTTQTASKVAVNLASNAAFASLDKAGIRNAALLLDGLQEFDAASFEKAFLRINNALSLGQLTEAQYKAIFNESIKLFDGVAQAFDTVKEAAKSLADQLLLDKNASSLTGQQSLTEATRQYREALAQSAAGNTVDLSGATHTMLDIAKQQAKSEVEYNRTFAKTIVDLRGIETLPAPAPTITLGDNKIIAQLQALRDELKAGQAQIASNTNKTNKKLDEFNINGMPTVALV